ncbi:neuronal acetylcholine receptor subunit alpha-7-like isoform X4 [Macrobrachium nipponense]|uniref:neuronal acetylcholine receptor subunit alpha-7-like isoform X4 n=1 Tax=Macrobrachium nipponense TaxID=159736 RepID=UPI0030C892C7
MSYNKLERPTANESDVIIVKLGLTLQQIINVDEKNQILTTNVWLNFEWLDYNLRWNKSDYGGVSDLRIPPKFLWTPDVLMYNSADEGFSSTYPTNVVVTSSGMCTYIPPGIFLSTCRIDITWYPFDDQKCNMKFGSWTYDSSKIDLQLQNEEGGDISGYITNGEWDLISVPAKRNTLSYSCCPEIYVDVTFQIHIRRRTLYYFSNLIMPCVLISSMALLGFTLPPDSGEKLTLATYFNCIMFMVASSVVLTVVVLNYHHRTPTTHAMPNWIRCLLLQWLPWILRMSRPGKKITRKTIMMNNKMRELELKERSSKSLLANVLDIDDDIRQIQAMGTGTPSHNGGYPRLVGRSYEEGGPIMTPHSSFCFNNTRELQSILRELRYITCQMRNEEEILDIVIDWKFAAMVVDRFCLITFTLYTVVATVVVILSAPHVLIS